MLDKDLTIYEMHNLKKHTAPMAEMLTKLLLNPHYRVRFYATPTILQKLVDAYGPIEDLMHIPKNYVPNMIYMQVEKTRFVQKVVQGNFAKEMFLP